VTYRPRRSHPPKGDSIEFTVHEPLLALADQVPHRNKHQVRYYGAAHYKIRRRLGITPELPVTRETRHGVAKSRWARLLYRVFGLEPLRCDCGATLGLVAVILFGWRSAMADLAG